MINLPLVLFLIIIYGPEGNDETSIRSEDDVKRTFVPKSVYISIDSVSSNFE